MPCVILLLKSQHSRLLDSAHALARTASARRDTWPGDLYSFRRLLVRHDQMERDVFQRLGAPVPKVGLGSMFDLALASQPGLDAVAVAAAAQHIARVIAEHADSQEDDLFPGLVRRHEESVRKRLGDRYYRMSLLDAEMDEVEAVVA